MGLEGVSGALSVKIAYVLDRSACLEILYDSPNWAFGSIYLETTRKFHLMQSPIHFVHPHTWENRLKVQEDFWHLPSALGETFGLLDFRNFSTILGHKSWWKEGQAGSEDGAWSHQGVYLPQGANGACGWHLAPQQREGAMEWKNLFLWHTQNISNLWYSLSYSTDS